MVSTLYIMNYMTHMYPFGMQPVSRLALSLVRPENGFYRPFKALYDQYGSVWDAILRVSLLTFSYWLILKCLYTPHSELYDQYKTIWTAAHQHLIQHLTTPNPYEMALTAYLVHYTTHTNQFGTQPVSHLAFRYLIPIKCFLHST